MFFYVAILCFLDNMQQHQNKQLQKTTWDPSDIHCRTDWLLCVLRKNKQTKHKETALKSSRRVGG